MLGYSKAFGRLAFGQAPTSGGSTAYTLVCAVGAFTLTGYAALKAIVRSSAVGTFVLTGYTTIRALGFPAAVGTFLLTGYTSIGTKTKILLAAAGSFVVTGVSANLNSVRTMLVATGAFVFTGFAAGLVKTKLLLAATGSFAVSGIATILHRGRFALYIKARGRDFTLLASRVLPSVLKRSRDGFATLKSNRGAPPKLGD